MGTDTVPVHPAIVPVNGECIFCSVNSYSIASRGSISKLDVSESDYMSCDNCSLQFCIGCINELIESVKGFNTIPPKVKMSDPTLRKIINIQKKMRSAITSTDFGPCCLFRVLDIRSALVKTPRPDPTVQCSRIESIKNYRQSIGKINKNKNKLTAIPKDPVTMLVYR